MDDEKKIETGAAVAPAHADQPTTYTMRIDPIGLIAWLRSRGRSFDQIAADCQCTLDGKPVSGAQLRRWYDAQIKQRGDP
jgi:hypothetical protein